MIKLIIWLLWLFILLFFCYSLSSRFIITPQFGFTICFIPQAIYALFYVNKWDLDLSFTTMVAIIGGTALFAVTSIVLQRVFNTGYHNILINNGGIAKAALQKNNEIMPRRIKIESWKLIVILAFQMVVLLGLIRYINTLVGNSFAEKMAYYNFMTKFVENGLSDKGLGMSSKLYNARLICIFIGYIFPYILLHSIIYKYKQHKILLSCNILASLICAIILGNRFDAVPIIISAFVQAYFIYKKKGHSIRVKIPAKTIAIIVSIGVILVVSFQSIGNIIGRDVYRDFGDYIAVYLSAPLKNLDIFVRENNFGCDASNWQTLYNVVNSYGRLFNRPDLVHMYDQPYRTINGFGLGNVYTQFYVFLHDGGFGALIIFVILMAVICQISFHKAMSGSKKNSLDLSVVIYSYIYIPIIFSFFSNRFYSQVISPQFIKFLLFAYVLRFFLTKVHFGSRESVTVKNRRRIYG